MKGQARFILLIVLAVVIVLVLQSTTKQPVFCTEEAKMCPDGTYVSRNPANNCAFDPCPAVGPVVDYRSFLANLRVHEYTPVEKGRVSQPFTTVEAMVVSIGADDFQVFEFLGAEDVENFSRNVSEDGSVIGTSIITWVEPPHFYKTDKVLVLYVGNKPDVTAALEKVLGKQFAGGPTYTFCDTNNRPQQCAEIYSPVCGWFDPEQIQCIRYPCAQDFSNGCFACGDSRVLYYSEGACPESNIPINVTEKTYVGNSAEECSRIRFLCVQGTEYFADEKGCGCQPSGTSY